MSIFIFQFLVFADLVYHFLHITNNTSTCCSFVYLYLLFFFKFIISVFLTTGLHIMAIVNLSTKFEVYSSTCSKITRGQKFKNRLSG